MRELIIKTNNAWRQFVYRHEVPASVLKDQFDYQNEDDVVDGFFKYKGVWYHLDQFMRVPPGHPFGHEGWSGYLNDSFFSGVLIDVSDDGEEYKVATFYS